MCRYHLDLNFNPQLLPQYLITVHCAVCMISIYTFFKYILINSILQKIYYIYVRDVGGFQLLEHTFSGAVILLEKILLVLIGRLSRSKYYQ